MSAIEIKPTWHETYVVEWTWVQREMAMPRANFERWQQWGRKYALYAVFRQPEPPAWPM